MAEAKALEEMGEDDVLAFADACAETIRQAEADLLRAAYQWAILHDPARLDPAASALPGREQARRLGGHGTPQVTEFAAAQFGARIGRSPPRSRAADRRRTRPAPPTATPVGPSRSRRGARVLRAARVQDDPRPDHGRGRLRRRRGRRARRRTHRLVPLRGPGRGQGRRRSTRSRPRQGRTSRQGNLRQEAPRRRPRDGHLHGPRRPAHHRRHRRRRHRPRRHSGRDDARRHRRPAPRPRRPAPGQPRRHPPRHPPRTCCPPCSSTCTPTWVPTATTTTEHGQIARLEGHGPLTEAWIQRVLGPNAKFKIQPVLDLAGQAPVDAYEIPHRHRQAVHLMTPADTFPFASNLSRNKQLDHTTPYEEGGETGVGNYGPMTVLHHRIKTHGRWQVQQPFPGIYLWRDPHGAFYLVDNTGTRRLRGAA